MDYVSIFESLLNASIMAATPVLFACLGEIFSERAGLLNLGVEGMMLIGAVTGFIVVVITENPVLGLLMAALFGAVLGILFAFLTVTLQSNQVVTGLALTIFGTGLSGFIGRPFLGLPLPVSFSRIRLPVLGHIPFVGSVFFNHDIVIYVLYGLVFVSWFYIFRTRSGMEMQAVGENPGAADAAGLNVYWIRYLYSSIGGALAGVGGAYLSLVLAPSWLDGMTAGRGWIAVALVIFAVWNPVRAMYGALLFGGVNVLGLRMQAFGVNIPSFFVRMLPYIFTILVLILVTGKIRVTTSTIPKALGLSYDREER